MNNFVAIIPAAGDSSRYSGEVPKQFLRVDGRTVLELSIKPILDFSECLGVCVLVPPDDPVSYTHLTLPTSDLV